MITEATVRSLDQKPAPPSYSDDPTEAHFERLYTDKDYFDSFSRSPEMDAATSASPLPDAVRYRAANQAYLANAIGVPIEQLNDTYEAQRDGAAKAWGGKPGGVSDADFFDLVAQKEQKKLQVRSALNEIPGDIVAARFQSGTDVSSAELLQQWKDKHSDLIPAEGDESATIRAASLFFAENDDWMTRNAAPAKAVFDTLDQLTKGFDQETLNRTGDLAKAEVANGEKFDALASQLVTMPKEDRLKLYGMAALYAKRGPEQEKSFTQFLENTVKSIDRSIGGVLVGLVNVERDRNATPEQREAIQVARELNQVANGSIDPIKPILDGWKGRLEEGAYNAAASAPYISVAAIPIAGAPLAIAAYSGQEYDRMRLDYPDIPIETVQAMSLVSGAVQGALDRLQVETIAGRLPVTGSLLKQLAKPSAPLIGRIAFGSGLNFAEQYGQETIQNLTPLVVDETARALGADMPARDWKKEFADFKEGQTQTFFALLPFWMLGTGAIGLREVGKGQEFSTNISFLEKAGFDTDTAESIAAEPDIDQRQKKFQAAFAELPESEKKRLIAETDAANSQAEAIQKSPGSPTVEQMRTADGDSQWVIRNSEGREIYRTRDEDAAVSAFSEAASAGFNSSRKAIADMVTFFEGVNERAGRGDAQTFEVKDEPRSLQTILSQGEVPIETLQERMRIAGIDPSTSLDSVRVLGENVSELRNNVFHDTIRIHQGASALTVIEERVEGEAKRAVSEGRVSMDWLRQQVSDYEVASGEKLLTESEQSVFEAVSTLGNAYVAGRVRDEALPGGLRTFLRAMVEYFKDVFARAGRLRKAFTEGKVGRDFEVFLAQSVGLDEQAQISEAAKAELGRTFAIAPAEYTAKLDAAIAALEKSPTARRERVEEGRKRLAKIRERAKEPVAVSDYDPEAAVDQIEQDRASDVADLRAEMDAEIERSGAEVVESFADRIENAKTEATKRALEREAKARATERKRAIESTYAEREKSVNSKARADKAQTRREADSAKRSDQTKSREQNSRAEMIQSFGELEAILSVLPPEARDRVGGFKRLSELKTNDARAKFLIERIAKVGDELESYLRKDYRQRIEKMLAKARPKQGDNKVKKSSLGPEAQRVADIAYASTLLDDTATAQRLAEIEGAMIAADISPERQSELVEEWGIVNSFGDLPNRNADSLASALEWLESSLKKGRSEWRIQEEARRQELATKRDDILSRLGKPGRRDIVIADQKIGWDAIVSGVDSFILSHYSFLQILERLIPKGAEVVTDWTSRVRRADNRSQDFTRRASDRLLEAMQAAIGSKSASKMAAAMWDLKQVRDGEVQAITGREIKNERIAVDLAEKIVRGEASKGNLSKDDIKLLREALQQREQDLAEQDFETSASGNDNARMREGSAFVTISRIVREGTTETVPMSRLEAIQYLLSWDQPDVRAKMEREGWTESSVEQMRAMTSDPASKAMAAFLRVEYGGSYGLANPVYRRMFGMNMPQVSNYAPTRYRNNKDAPDIGPFGGPLESSGVTPGFAKSRVSHNAMMRQMDALTVFWQHTAQQAHFIHYAELTREMRGVLQSSDVRSSIEAAYGREVVQQLDQWIEAIATQGGNKSAELLVDSKLLDALISAKAVASLGGNLRTIAMQFDSALRFIFAMPGREITKALSDIPGILSTIPEAWHSDSVQRRLVNGSSPEVRYLYERQRVKPSLMMKLAEYAMLPIQYADAFLTSVSGAAVYRSSFLQAKTSGAPDDLAARQAGDAMDDAVYRYSQPVGLASRSLREVSGNRAQKIFMMFMSDARLKTALYAEAVHGLVKGTGDRGANVRRILAVQTMAMASQVLANVYRDAFSDDTDDEIWNAQGFIKAFALAPLSGYFVLGAAADVAFSQLLGQKTFSDSENPLVGIATNAGRAAKNFDDAWNPEDPDAMLKEWNAIARSAAVAGPASAVPAVVVNLLKPVIGAIENAQKPDEAR